MKKIYRKPTAKRIVIEDSLLQSGSPFDPAKPVTLNFDLDYIEDEGYAD